MLERLPFQLRHMIARACMSPRGSCERIGTERGEGCIASGLSLVSRPQTSEICGRLSPVARAFMRLGSHRLMSVVP